MRDDALGGERDEPDAADERQDDDDPLHAMARAYYDPLRPSGPSQKARHRRRGLAYHRGSMRHRSLVISLLVLPSRSRRALPDRSTGRSFGARAATAWRTSRRCRSVVTTAQRRLGRRRAGPRLVVADRLARSGLRDDRRQRRRLQEPVNRHLRQRLRRGAREAGLCPTRRSSSASSIATSS